MGSLPTTQLWTWDTQIKTSRIPSSAKTLLVQKYNKMQSEATDATLGEWTKTEDHQWRVPSLTSSSIIRKEAITSFRLRPLWSTPSSTAAARARIGKNSWSTVSLERITASMEAGSIPNAHRIWPKELKKRSTPLKSGSVKTAVSIVETRSPSSTPSIS